ncbi:MAG: hypothetical protein KatS3mg083_292 [Candidatus Dojkabacteria bacterium]|nr:MAG: hypothetical protein KatS3mg083_292 [Candidatus Dojkabacteria bacterium]
MKKKLLTVEEFVKESAPEIEKAQDKIVEKVKNYIKSCLATIKKYPKKIEVSSPDFVYMPDTRNPKFVCDLHKKVVAFLKIESQGIFVKTCYVNKTITFLITFKWAKRKIYVIEVTI